MSRLHIYVVFEILKVFAIVLFAVTAVIMLGGVVQQLISEGLGVFAILELLPYVLPIALQFAIPVSLLFAACSVYGRMSADNEIVALKSIGISPGRVMSPSLVLAFLLSPLAVWASDLAMSWGMPGINRVVMHSIEEVVYRVLRNQRSYSTSQGFSIHVLDVQDSWLIRPTINVFPESGAAITISAARGKLKMDAETETLRIQLEDSQWELGDGTAGAFPGITEEVIPLNRAMRRGVGQRSPSQFALSEMAEERQLQVKLISARKEEMATMIGLNLMSGRFDRLESQEAREVIGNLAEAERRLNRIFTEPYRRWAMGFSCFFFVWLGVPMAIWMKSADYWTSFGACFLPILVMYYPLFAMGFDRAKNGVWPPYAVWLGDIVLFFVGLWFMRKVYRN